MRPPLPTRSLILFGVTLCGSVVARAAEPVRVVAADGEDRGAKQPQVAVAGSGRIFVAFGRDNLVRCASSEDGGQTYKVATVGTPGVLALGMRRGPRVAVAGEAAIVTAIGGTQGKGKDGDVLAWRSADGGGTWSGPTRVNRVEGSAREGLHGLAAAPDGRAFCTWLDLRSGRMEVWGARSADGGQTWEADALVYRAPDGPICPCCHPSAAFGPDGSLWVMWRNSLGGSRDLYAARSADGGRTFGPAEKLGQRTWKLDACPMDGGALAIGPDGAIVSAWMRAGSAYRTGPGEPERLLGNGVQPWLTLGPDGPISVWLDRRPGRLLALRPGDAAPAVLAERANDPVVAAAPGNRAPVVAAWEDPAAPGGIVSLVLTPPPAASPR